MKPATQPVTQELESELAEARSLLDAIANSTEHADAAQKWELAKAELLNAVRDAIALVQRNDSDGWGDKFQWRAQTLIAKYEAK